MPVIEDSNDHEAIDVKLAKEAIEKLFGGRQNLKFLADESLMHFDKTHWKAISSNAIQSRIFNAFLDDLGNAPVNMAARICKCITLTIGEEETVFHKDNPASQINVFNGELWLDEQGNADLKPHDPATKNTYCLPFEYDPKATCPKFDKALADIFSASSDPEEMIRHFYEFVGYVIQPERPTPMYWLFYGGGANGKTKLLQTLQRLMSTDVILNKQISSFQSDKFNMAELIGKLVLIDDDLTEGVVLNDGLIKTMGEAKAISGRKAYGKSSLKFTSRVVPIMAGNSFPKTKDVSHGMLRRAYVFPFAKKFSEQEQDINLFKDIWATELPGILNKALAGIKRLKQRKMKFDIPADCEKAATDFIIQANPFAYYLSERCEKCPEGRIKLPKMRNDIKLWAKEQGIAVPPHADNTLKKKLGDLGYSFVMQNGYPAVVGLNLKHQPLE